MLKALRYANRGTDPGGEARRREGATADCRACHRGEALPPLLVSPRKLTLTGHMTVMHRRLACLQDAAEAQQVADTGELWGNIA